MRMTQSIQFIYPIVVLNMYLVTMLGFRVSMRCGQSAAWPTAMAIGR